MNRRAQELITALDLEPHPEGGHFRRVHRSASTVALPDGRDARPALTSIYYLLAAGERSRWHRVASDEAWHHYEGDPLELLLLDIDDDRLERRVLGPVGSTADGTDPGGRRPSGPDAAVETAAEDARTAADAAPVHVVPAGVWQAARPLGEYALVGCSVGPGFAYEDFTLMVDQPDAADDLRRRRPELADLL